MHMTCRYKRFLLITAIWSNIRNCNYIPIFRIKIIKSLNTIICCLFGYIRIFSIIMLYYIVFSHILSTYNLK